MEQKDEHRCTVVIIGAGPAGLTAAHELIKQGCHPIVLEQQDKVGGIARTENYKGYHFDMGGHRFFTKAPEVRAMWQATLGSEFLRRPRLSRIYYQDKFFHYPLKPLNAFMGLGLVQATQIIASYVRWQLFPYKHEETFEQWVTNRFGQRLFEIFFKTYTEKVWGIPCSELKAEWAAQRIKDLSLKSALVSMFVKSKTTITTLIEEFDYPRLGPGMLWNQVKKDIEQQGGEVLLNTEVVEIHRTGDSVDSVVVACKGQTPESRIIHADYVISSMPVSEFVKKLNTAPADVVAAANQLTYRDFLTVCLIVNQPNLFFDNWIYVHAPEVQVGRIQNFKNWSPDMVPDPSKTSLGLEYFCNEGDALWTMSDTDLIALGKREIDSIGLARSADVEDGCVFRVQKAYPVYNADYREYLATIKEFVGTLKNFQTIGRNGLHRYNNQDHSMLTGMAAVRNLILGEHNDLWSINADKDYHEEVREDKSGSAPAVMPELMRPRVIERVHPISFGLAVGCTVGLMMCLATLFLVIKGGANMGANMQLLGQFFGGYSVTPAGSLIGLTYGLVAGFLIGSVGAYLRNLLIYLSAHLLYRDIERNLLRQFLDYI